MNDFDEREILSKDERQQGKKGRKKGETKKQKRCNLLCSDPQLTTFTLTPTEMRRWKKEGGVWSFDFDIGSVENLHPHEYFTTWRMWDMY